MHRTLDAGPEDARELAPIVRAAYRYLASSPAKLVMIPFDDAALEFEQVNVPGTFVEYPNWRRKNGVNVEALADDPQIAALASDVDVRVRRGTP
jgi:4-alpha-glucanotransferase